MLFCWIMTLNAPNTSAKIDQLRAHLTVGSVVSWSLLLGRAWTAELV